MLLNHDMNANEPIQKLIQLNEPPAPSSPSSGLLSWLIHNDNAAFKTLDIKTVCRIAWRRRLARSIMKKHEQTNR